MGTLRKRYIALSEGPTSLLLIVRENRDGSLYWEVYNAMNASAKRLNSLRQGVLLCARKPPAES